MVQKVKQTIEHAYEKNTSWQSRKRTKKTIKIYLKSKKTTYTQGEMTSQNLWSRYDRQFVGITRNNAFN